MSIQPPKKVLLTGGAEGGGVASYANALAGGFRALGMDSEVIAPRAIYSRVDELRDASVLKFLSTTAAFAVPVARRAFVIAHGFPCVANQGWVTTLGVLASYKLANLSHGAQLLVVSNYSALHLEQIFNLRVDGVVRNPVLPLFEEPWSEPPMRRALTYVGRLHHSKNLARLLPAMISVLKQTPELEVWILGEGPEREALTGLAAREAQAFGVELDRVRFFGALKPEEVRDRLRQSRVFLSANPTEPFGIVYLEALSQGAAVVMPASGGGLEIAPKEIGQSIFLFPTSMELEGIATAILHALHYVPRRVELSEYSARAVAERYLDLDACFNLQGEFERRRGDESA